MAIPMPVAIPAPREAPFSLRSVLSKLALSLAIVGFGILAVSYGPSLYFWAQTKLSAGTANFQLSKTEVTNLDKTTQVGRSRYTPPIDPKLPTTNRLIISSIGVKTEIQEATYNNYESALEKGAWRVSDFGAPSDNSMPTILAAHRFGYLAWTNLFRRQNSFYNLPKLNVGDVVEIDWRQRKYLYEIYASDQGTEISDYSADLILYTCVDLSGPERIFKYARLMEI
jgi:sortase (surface protein transpeptidase)